MITCLTACPTRTGGYQGGVVILTMEKPIEWGIESTRYQRPNMVICKIITGLIRTPLVSVYFPPSTLNDLLYLEEALKRFKDPIVLGDLNMDLEKARSP